MASFWRLLERLAVAAMLCVLAVLVGVAVLTAPWFTKALTARLDVAPSAGLSPPEAASTAELVRRFVTTRSALPLPTTVAGRGGFDAAASSHLEDVRDVVLASRIVGIVLALAISAWLAIAVYRRRPAEIASALRWGAYACLVAPLIIAAAGFVSFDALFAAFHGLFFVEGTWTFAADSLLIELFPERFWTTAGASLALLVVVQGIVLWTAGGAVVRRERRRGQLLNEAGA